jgi:Family of unknown function (DUF5995)
MHGAITTGSALQGGAMSIDALITAMTAISEELSQAGDARLAFHATYLRTTRAVADALRAGVFDDADWVERWDVAFADLYLDALDAARNSRPVPRPWAVAFSAAADRDRTLPALQHVLLGMNAHINFDLPQALLAVISDDEFGDPELLARRGADHRRIDDVLSARVSAEDDELRRLEPAPSWRDDLLQPLNRAATRQFLRESRAKVWANAMTLSQARRHGPADLARQLAALEELSAARVADLLRPGPVLLRLARRGFGVTLPPDRGRAAAAPGDIGAGARAAQRAGHGGPAVPRDRDPGPLQSFDPVGVGRLECAVWIAYYQRKWPRFLVLSLRLVHRAFRMDWTRTVYGAWLVLRANQLWAPAANDVDGARRCMRRFYALLKLAHGQPADPARAARLEVDWWAAHRAHQNQPGPDGATPLITALARLYAYLYGLDEEAVRPAAEQRAIAMDASDEWVAQGCRDSSPLLAAERAALVRSYAALLAAVHR